MSEESPENCRTCVVTLLQKVRDPLAEHQCCQGISSVDKLSFLTLIVLLCQHAYHACITILKMMYELLPFVEGFLFICRFVLDNAIDVLECETTSDALLKGVIFLVELVIVVLLFVLIMAIILMPVILLAFHYFTKVYGYIRPQ